MKITDNEGLKKEVFQYLERLRKSGGAGNMWGASMYIEDEFGMDERDAKHMLLAWIQHKREEVKP
jgi:hypothetical protein